MSDAIETTAAREGDQEALQRFGQVLRHAMVVNGLSERRLASALGITIGTTQKYFRGKVHPLKVATEITYKLAGLLGMTSDSLVRFYEGGAYESDLTLEDVVRWLRSNAGQEHLGPLLEAMSQVGNREGLPPKRETLKPFTWPMQELVDAGISPALRERMGLGDEVMERLSLRGEYTEEMVEAFSVAANLEVEAVREAFKARVPAR
jgi:transcriptional regulator with XRE-family HTH domain